MADDDTDIEGSDLSAVIATELRQALSYDSTELSSKRARAIEYMQGVMTDTPPRPHGSKQTSRDFADTVSWILPGTVRVFTASDQMVQYDKVSEENDDWSRDATEYTNYSFFRESDGYRILYNATYDSLTLGNGLVCSYWEPERVDTKLFRNKTEMEIAALLEDGWQGMGLEPRPGKPRPELLDDPLTGDTLETEVPTWTLKLGKVQRPGRICDITCKPENLLLNSAATEIDHARFVSYLHDDKTRSDLMEMADDYGWDKEVIESLPSYSRPNSNTEVSLARQRDRPMNYASPTKSGDPIDLYVCYIRADMDGDGVAELIQAWWAGDPGGGTLLGHDEWDDDVPYTDIPCYPVPHRWDAESVFDRTEDIQRVKTVLLRQGLDNTYATNLPMWEADAGSVLNPDILVSPRFGATIWKKAGTQPMVPHLTPYVADKSFAAMQYLDEMIAKRTGVSRTTMALDPEALQNQTATAAQQQRDAGYSQIELVARNMAEYGWSKFFKKRLKQAIKHEQIRKIPSKEGENGFREIDPSKWDADMAVSINVGLGTGSRDRDMAMLNQIMMGQIGMADRLGASGFTSKALEFLPKIRNTAVKLAESSGLKNPEEFYPEITDEEVVQMQQQAEQAKQQPDAKIMLEQERAKADIAIQQEKTAADAQSNAQKLQLEANKATNELILKREQLAAEMQLKREQLSAELQLKREQMVAELAIKRELGLASAASSATASTSGVHVGGEPG